jgi:hypothetical protein
MRILPHAVAVILFVIVASLFFDMVGEDYGLKQPDFEKVIGMAKESADYRIAYGEEALWANVWWYAHLPDQYDLSVKFASQWRLHIQIVYFTSGWIALHVHAGHVYSHAVPSG